MPHGARRAGARRAWCAPVCDRVFERRGGVWRFLTPTRGGGSSRSCGSTAPSASAKDAGPSSPEYYQRLPSVAPDDPHAGEWRVRRETYHHLQRHVLPTVRGRFTCSTSAPAAAGCRTGWPRSVIASSPSTRSTTRRMAWARAVTTRCRFRRAGRLRRAAVRAGAVRSRRLQRIAALRGRTRRDAGRARTRHARARRRARGDGLADVPRDRDGAAMVDDSCAASRSTTASPRSCARASGS